MTDSSRSAAVQIDHITHRYGDHRALDDVTFTVPTGTLFGLLGPNGSGKTTLFRIITTLLTPSSGRISIFGTDPRKNPHAVRQSISMIFQNPALDEQLTVEENIRLHGSLYGLGRQTLNRRVAAVLEQLGLSGRADDRVGTLSGGLKRRADLARGLLHEPRLLLLDEPTSGLDPRARRLLWEHLQTVRESSNTTILTATHLMEEAERCDQLAIINDGTLGVTGTPEGLRRGLGNETLWLESEAPRQLKDRIEARFGYETQIIGRALQVKHEEAHIILSGLYEAFEDRITSATVRRPTLEDVFMAYTGQSIQEPLGQNLSPLA